MLLLTLVCDVYKKGRRLKHYLLKQTFVTLQTTVEKEKNMKHDNNVEI